MRFLSFDFKLNETPEDTKRECTRLFDKAEHSIKIIGGNLNNPFYKDTEVRTALSSAAKRGVTVEIVGSSPEATRGQAPIKPLKIPKVKVVTLKQPAIRHMMSIDGKHARIEKKHAVGSAVTPAVICKNASFIARDIDSYFDSLVASK